MSILIKGMEMPISCEECPLCYDYLFCSIDDSLRMFLYNRHPNCPLVEISKSHGRLIDVDELLSHLSKDPLFDLVERYGVSGVIESRPTILEAEEE